MTRDARSIAVAIYRSAAGVVHYMGGISVALRPAILRVQDVPHRAHVDGVCADNPCIHRRAVRGHLPPTTRSSRVHTGASCQDALCALGRRVAVRRTVLSAHSHVPLP